MTALRLDGELGLVDRGKGEVPVEFPVVMRIAAGNGHAFGSAEEIARLGRDDPLFAGQQRNLLLALDGNNAVIDFAGEKAEREADDARAVTTHPVDREVGLPRVGRSEDRPDGSVGTRRHHDECGSVPAERKGRFVVFLRRS